MAVLEPGAARRRPRAAGEAPATASTVPGAGAGDGGAGKALGTGRASLPVSNDQSSVRATPRQRPAIPPAKRNSKFLSAGKAGQAAHGGTTKFAGPQRSSCLARSSKSSGWMRGRATSQMHVVGVLEKKRVPA